MRAWQVTDSFGLDNLRLVDRLSLPLGPGAVRLRMAATSLNYRDLLMVGGVFVLGRLLFAPEAGAPFAVVAETWRMGKLTLGSWDFSLTSFTDPKLTTTWLFCLAYAVQWTRRYATDQHIVQRYLVAESDEAASRADSGEADTAAS